MGQLDYQPPSMDDSVETFVFPQHTKSSAEFSDFEQRGLGLFDISPDPACGYGVGAGDIIARRRRTAAGDVLSPVVRAEICEGCGDFGAETGSGTCQVVVSQVICLLEQFDMLGAEFIEDDVVEG
jgi:hypothetical protein